MSFVLILHGGPFVLSRRPDVGAHPSTGKNKTLASHGLLPVRDTGRDKSIVDLWHFKRIPVAEQRLLKALILESDFNPTYGFSASESRLRRAGFQKRNVERSTLLSRLANLRSVLGKTTESESGDPIHKTDNGFALDTSVIRCDWFDVLSAEAAAISETDAYEKAFFLSLAERTFVESRRLVPEDVLSGVRLAPPDYTQAMVKRRWALRGAYLRTLLSIDHTDTMITEFRLWRETANEGGSCSDEFFDWDVGAALRSLGRIEMPDGKKLWEAAQHRHRPVARSNPNSMAQLSREIDRAKIRSGGTRRAKSRKVTRLPEVDFGWEHVDASLRLLIDRIRHEYGQRSIPQVVVAIGRGGSLVAASLSELLPCRSVGLISIDRYHHRGTQKSGEPYIRAVELPNRRACQVLICDDVIWSGETMRKAIDEGVRPAYPDADFLVCSLILNGRARRNARSGPGDRKEAWLAGLEIDIADEERFWINFCWKTLPRKKSRRVRKENQ